MKSVVDSDAQDDRQYGDSEQVDRAAGQAPQTDSPKRPEDYRCEREDGRPESSPEGQQDDDNNGEQRSAAESFQVLARNLA
jgi:hypothetical protein